MTEHLKQAERDNILARLTDIIATQSRLAEANFDVDAFMNLVCVQVQHLTKAIGVVVELVEGDEMVYRAGTGTVAQHVGLRLKKSNSISGLCVSTHEILICKDTEMDSRVNLDACRRVHARSLVVAPLFHQGEAIGVIKILSNKLDAFSQDDVETLSLMAGLIGSALAHQISHAMRQQLLDERTITLEKLRQSEEKLKHMAQHDSLTDLPNRSLFLDRLTSALLRVKRNKKLLGILFLDIDHFKVINDTKGHAIGDELLKAFAGRIKQCVRQSDTAARLGGDEFIILLDEIIDKQAAIDIAVKIINRMQEPFQFTAEKITISTSIGITICDNNKISADELIKQADDALYQAKSAGRNNYQIYKEN